MAQSIRSIILAGILLLAGLAVGFFLGFSRGQLAFIELTANEAQGSLGVTVEVLSRLRTGDEKGALELLERQADTLIMTLPQDREYSLCTQGAKLYRMAYPPPPDSSPELFERLRKIPTLPKDHEHCSPALKRVTEISTTGQPQE